MQIGALPTTTGCNEFFNKHAPEDCDILNFMCFIDPKGKKALSMKNINQNLHRYLICLSWCRRHPKLKKIRFLTAHVKTLKDKYQVNDLRHSCDNHIIMKTISYMLQQDPNKSTLEDLLSSVLTSKIRSSNDNNATTITGDNNIIICTNDNGQISDTI
jgi:hypothetical protein